MSSTASTRHTAGRPRWGGNAVVWGLAVLAMVAAFFQAADALPHAGVERAARLVDRLAELGGLTERGGRVTARPLAVAVNQEGGPLWVQSAVTDAATTHAAYVVSAPAPNLIRVEVIADETHVAMLGGLYRQGWNLRNERPLRVRILPWIPILALAGGLWVFAWTRRSGWGLAVAGVAAQGFAAMVAWPPDVPTVSWTDAVRDGPLGASIIELAARLPDASVAVGAGIVTLCGVLIAFDHRRSSGRGGVLLAAGLLGATGLLVWLEAAARCGFLGWMTTAAGIVAVLAMALAWGVQARTLALRR